MPTSHSVSDSIVPMEALRFEDPHQENVIWICKRYHFHRYSDETSYSENERTEDYMDNRRGN